jgi:hypothetical protein
LIGSLEYPSTIAARQGWLFVLALVWQAPQEEKTDHFAVLGEQLARVRSGSGGVRDWAHIITVIQGSIMYSSASEEIILSIGELQRRSRWVQSARRLLNQPFGGLVTQWKKEVGKS